jgi:hypothetical protein
MYHQVLAEKAKLFCSLLDRYPKCGQVTGLVADCYLDFCWGGANMACETMKLIESTCREAGIAFESNVDECGVCLGDGTGCDATCSAFGGNGRGRK